MGKIAFVFSGQGAQYPGMGKELYDNIAVSREIFDKADSLKPGLMKMCFEGDAKELAETKNTQPCMFTMEMAAARALEEKGVKADAVAGFSLGEIAAITYGGLVNFEEGLRLVSLRGKFMQEDITRVDSGMVAVVKLSPEKVDELAAKYEKVFPVNYNGPMQVSVAGLNDQLDEFIKDVKEAGGRAIPIRVRGGFHSEFVEAAAASFGEALESFDLKAPRLTVYSDYTALPYEGDYKELLSKQICNPVRWHNIVTNMIENGFDIFIEIGPGKTLSGLISKINGKVTCLQVEDVASLAKTVETLRGTNMVV